MRTEQLRETIKDFAKDIRLNLSSVLTEEGSPGLSQQQIWAIALACAYSSRYAPLIEAIRDDGQLSESYTDAAKAAASVMAMNNVYYRFLHLADDKEFSKMPAKLRMNVIGKPGIERRDFELMSLAVSAIAGCGSCINSHVSEVKKAGITNEGVQSAVRIASVINATVTAHSI